MGNIFNDDFRDFLATLNDQQVRYLLVGWVQDNFIHPISQLCKHYVFGTPAPAV